MSIFNKNKVVKGTAVPTSGYWNDGDMVINSNQVIGGDVVGWKCTVSGTPGIWNIMGQTASLNVKDYGITGDGSTDDTTAIQAVIDLLSSNVTSPKTIFFPAGNYKITSNIIFRNISAYGSPYHIIGEGPDSRIIQYTNNIPILRFGYNQNGWTFSSLRFSYNEQQSDSNTSGVAMLFTCDEVIGPETTSYDGIIENCYFDKCYRGIGIDPTGGVGGSSRVIALWATTFRNLIFTNCIKNGIYIQSPGAGGHPNNKFSHIRCFMEGDLANANTGEALDLRQCVHCTMENIDIEVYRNRAMYLEQFYGTIQGVHLEHHEMRSNYNGIIEVSICDIVLSGFGFSGDWDVTNSCYLFWFNTAKAIIMALDDEINLADSGSGSCFIMGCDQTVGHESQISIMGVGTRADVVKSFWQSWLAPKVAFGPGVPSSGGSTISAITDIGTAVGILDVGPLNPLSVKGGIYAANQDGGISVVGLNGVETRWEGSYNLRSNSGGTPRMAFLWKTRDASEVPTTDIEVFAYLATGNIGVGTVEPGINIGVSGGNFTTGRIFHIKGASSVPCNVVIEGNSSAAITLCNSDESSNNKNIQLIVDGGILTIRSLNDNMSVRTADIMTINLSTGAIITASTMKSSAFYVGSNQVLGARQSGVSAMTNLTTPSNLNADTVTTAELADIVGNLIDKLRTTGVVGD